MPDMAKKQKDTAALVRKKRPYTLSVEMCMDSMLTEERTKLETRLAAIDRRLRVVTLRKAASEELADVVKQAEEAQARLDELLEEIEEQTVEFVFKAIPRAIYAQMIREMPPTPEQIATAKVEAEAAGQPEAAARLNVDSDRFPPELVFRALVEPKLSREDVEKMWDPEDETWNTLELTVLYQTAKRASESISIPR